MGQGNKQHSQRKFVRVTGCRGKDLIEFDFAIGSPDLFVELILPEAALAEFCRNNEVELLTSGDDAPEHDALHWRLRDAAQGLAHREAKP